MTIITHKKKNLPSLFTETDIVKKHKVFQNVFESEVLQIFKARLGLHVPV